MMNRHLKPIRVISYSVNGKEIELNASKNLDIVIDGSYKAFAELAINRSVDIKCKATHFIGVDNSSIEDITSISLSGYVWIRVQARTHKKKRVNKKWLKKYGLKDIRVRKTYVSDNFRVSRDDIKDEFKIEMSNVEEI